MPERIFECVTCKRRDNFTDLCRVREVPPPVCVERETVTAMCLEHDVAYTFTHKED